MSTRQSCILGEDKASSLVLKREEKAPVQDHFLAWELKSFRKFWNLKAYERKKSFLRRLISPKYRKFTFCENWIKAEVLRLANVIQAQSGAWQAVRNDQPPSSDFKMTTSPMLHMKPHPSFGGCSLLFSGYWTFFS